MSATSCAPRTSHQPRSAATTRAASTLNPQSLPQVITIDGTSGSGKGTIGLLVANKLGWNYLDSGAIYRALACYAQQQGVIVQDKFLAADLEQKLTKLAEKLPIEFKQAAQDQPANIYLAGSLVTDQVRAETTGLAASKIAGLPAVRTALLARQRACLQPPGLVADGRDMGTVVFPQAILKIFLEASVEERAKRRYKQLKMMGLSANLQGLIGEIAARDDQDRNRAVAPMKPAADAIVIDTSNLDIAAVFAKVMGCVHQVLASNPRY